MSFSHIAVALNRRIDDFRRHVARLKAIRARAEAACAALAQGADRA